MRPEVRTRCLDRAQNLEDEADITQMQLDGMSPKKDDEWERWEVGKSLNSQYRVRLFQDRLSELRRSIEICREDAAHYREMAND